MPDDLDPASLAVVLSVEYALIDPALIAALLSDYPPNTLLQNLDQIKEHLGILEATLVPDSDDPRPQESMYGEGESWSGSDANNGNNTRMDALGDRMGRIDIGGRNSGDSRELVSECGNELEFSDEIDLLKSLFPNLTLGEMQKALSSEQNLPGAIDHLLSLDLIRETEERGYWVGESEEVLRPVVENCEIIKAKNTKEKADNVGLSLSALTHSASKSKRKKKPKTSQTIPLVDTLQRGARSLTPIPPVVHSISSSSSSRASSPAGDTKESNSATTSLATYLHELLPSLSISHFLWHLESTEYPSLYHATRASLTSIPRSRASPFLSSYNEDDISSGLLQDVYGVSLEAEGNPWSVPREERERHKDLEMCIGIAGQDVATVMDLMDLPPHSISPSPPVEEEEQEQEQVDDDEGWAKPLAASTSKRPVSSLPGPVTRPVPPTKISKSQKTRVVPGALPSSMANATDSFGVASPSPGMIKPHAVGGPHPTNWQTVRSRSRTKDRKSRHGQHPLAESIPAYSRGGATTHDLYNQRLSSSFHGEGDSRAKTQMEEYLYQVQVERARREAAIRAAGRSFVGGGRAVRAAVSGHYAREAREAAERIRHLEMRAAELVIASQLDSNRPTRPSREENRSKMIDLHHLTVSQAVNVSEKAVDKWWIKEHKAGWRVDKGETSRGYLVVHGRK
ncbi:hypothetical protein I305_01986 [Cryptococcus gattii E566]|uniref:CUE domain-containing protein n=1 Tax=Cryptococcus gattii serotype B (strain WM276 / ATCC MYA-4071) TaxID=367775 RepID=E6R4F2_CRYGW|nr:uncharacterized protein CGB_D6500W [Cryptococcus gattii WM276]ADV21941.1 hypothetical protein CND03790 [Cryptococcus gattii WM276]KIY35735.1 hypothetical protein I305_01986 [Cryptococcus gattii E566]